MSSNIENQMDKILDEYLEGNISEAEVKAIHQRLQLGDPLLDIDQELEKISLPADLLVSTMKAEPTPTLPPNTSIEAYLNDRAVFDWEKKHTSRRNTLKIAQRYALVGAILFAIVLLVPMLHLFLPFSNTQPLFDKYFELPTMVEHLSIEKEEKVQKLWVLAEDYYKDKSFTPAINVLNDVVKMGQSSEADFYIGVAYLAKPQHQPRLAIQHLEAANQNSELLAAQAQWYLALAHLKSGDSTKSRAILETIVAETEDYYKGSAKQLLEDLKAYRW